MRKKRRRRNHQGPRKQELWTILRPSWPVETDQDTVRVEIMKNSRAPSNQSGFDINTVWHRQVIFQSIPPVFQCLTFWMFTAFLFFQQCSFTLCFLKWVHGTVVRLMPFSKVYQYFQTYNFRCIFREGQRQISLASSIDPEFIPLFQQNDDVLQKLGHF